MHFTAMTTYQGDIQGYHQELLEDRNGCSSCCESGSPCLDHLGSSTGQFDRILLRGRDLS
jgi:hypothetical protein